jgi:hypothetical protein
MDETSDSLFANAPLAHQENRPCQLDSCHDSRSKFHRK